MEEFMLYDLIEKNTPELFAEIKKDHKVMCANVDMYSGFVYKMLGCRRSCIRLCLRFRELLAGARIGLRKLRQIIKLCARPISRL